jgi:hypothetical protein
LSIIYGICKAVSYKENFVENVFASVYVRFKKNLLILNFQTSVTQLATHEICTCVTVAPHWWLHREMREMICVLRTQAMTSFGHIALDGAVGPMDTPQSAKNM